MEYWVNIRTEGTLSKEDMESLTHEKKYEGTGGDELNFKPRVHLDGFGFDIEDPMLHRGEPSKEGDKQKPASWNRTRVVSTSIRPAMMHVSRITEGAYNSSLPATLS